MRRNKGFLTLPMKTSPKYDKDFHCFMRVASGATGDDAKCPCPDICSEVRCDAFSCVAEQNRQADREEWRRWGGDEFEHRKPRVKRRL